MVIAYAISSITNGCKVQTSPTVRIRYRGDNATMNIEIKFFMEVKLK